SCLENQNSWIFLPKKVDYFGSNDGVIYSKIGSVESSDIDPVKNINRYKFSKSFSDVDCQYLKVIAENVKYCPDDHPAAGGKAWLFVDEIIVE
ncbi:MAG: hypothetical protein R3250_06625, partial [Melioribacteraceae bacterium]|nr:hypothetical protein [Melioribacteraceae bacterium]